MSNELPNEDSLLDLNSDDSEKVPLTRKQLRELERTGVSSVSAISQSNLSEVDDTDVKTEPKLELVPNFSKFSKQSNLTPPEFLVDHSEDNTELKDLPSMDELPEVDLTTQFNDTDTGPRKIVSSLFEITESDEVEESFLNGMSEEDLEDSTDLETFSNLSNIEDTDENFVKFAEDLEDETDEAETYGLITVDVEFDESEELPDFDDQAVENEESLETVSEDVETDSVVESSNSIKNEDMTTVEELEEDDVVYKKERPALKFILWFVGITLAIFLILAIIGFVIGWTGGRPPTLDNEALKNAWDNVTGGGGPAVPNTPVDELTKNPK